MTRDDTEPGREPPESPVDDAARADESGAGDADTEGHSLLTLELGRTIERERVRETEKSGRDRARAREALPGRSGGILKRFRRD